MKYVAIALVLVLALMVGYGAYLYMNANVEIVDIQSISFLAEENSEVFEGYKRDLANGSILGTVYDAQALGEASEYVYYTYVVTLKNGCYVPAEMVEVQIEPIAGDVLAFTSDTVTTLPRQAQGDFTSTILTNKDNHATRKVIITYFLWGYKFSLEKVYG